jgi:DNA polymerase-3 subunit gamma/tau
MVVVSSEQGAPTIKSQAGARKLALEKSVRDDPLVKAVLERFPGAEIVGVHTRNETPEPPPLDLDDTIPSPDLEDDNDR